MDGGNWEIVRATKSPTKFIVTDDPVAFYCKMVFESQWVYPNEMSPKQIGTPTIFPLGLDSCIIITHVQLLRDPWSTPTEMRTNARSYQSAMKHLGNIQFGRELEEDEVLRINYILKRRAVRYIAAAEKDWLYPERHVSTTEWTKLDDDWFLSRICGRFPSRGRSWSVTVMAHRRLGTSTVAGRGNAASKMNSSAIESGKRASLQKEYGRENESASRGRWLMSGWRVASKGSRT